MLKEFNEWSTLFREMFAETRCQLKDTDNSLDVLGKACVTFANISS